MRIATLLFFVVLSSAASAQMLNGGFEEWTDGKPDHWEALWDFSVGKISGFVGSAACSVATSELHGHRPQAFQSKSWFKRPSAALGFSFWFNGWAYSPYSLVYSIKSGSATVSDTLSLPLDHVWSNVSIQFPAHILTDNDSLYMRIESFSVFGPIGFKIDNVQFDGEMSRVDDEGGVDVSIQPNPISSHGKLNFFSDKYNVIHINVYDHLGRDMFTNQSINISKGATSIPFNVTGLPNGLYYLRCSTGGEIITRKLLVSH